MDNIFGLSMNAVLVVCLAIMGLCLLTTAVIALRNRVIFKMAIRNIPRRKAQTTARSSSVAFQGSLCGRLERSRQSVAPRLRHLRMVSVLTP